MESSRDELNLFRRARPPLQALRARRGEFFAKDATEFLRLQRLPWQKHRLTAMVWVLLIHSFRILRMFPACFQAVLWVNGTHSIINNQLELVRIMLFSQSCLLFNNLTIWGIIVVRSAGRLKLCNPLWAWLLRCNRDIWAEQYNDNNSIRRFAY